MKTKIDGDLLLRIARETLGRAFGAQQIDEPTEEFLNEKRAVFVTLTKNGELRGCIGQLAPRFTLLEAVRDAVRAAAFRDTRFPPLAAEELPEVTI